MSTHEIKLTFSNGTPLAGWAEADVTIDMLSPGSPWTLTLHHSDGERDRFSAWWFLQQRALLEESIALWIDDTCQLRGRIERRKTRCSREGATITISGRDIASRAIDSDADPGIFLKNVTLKDALDRLFLDVGLTPEILSGEAQAIVQSTPRRTRGSNRIATRRETTSLKVHPGERIWQVAEKLARQQGYMLWCAPSFANAGAGRDAVGIVVDRPNETIPENPSIVLARLSNGDGTWRGNILESDYDLASQNIPTHVVGFSRTTLNSDGDSSDRRVVINDKLRDHPKVKPTRPLGLWPRYRYIAPERSFSGDRVEKECQKVIAEANAELETYECTVQGFGQAGKLYAVNSIARVRDELEEPAIDGNFLITRVHFHQSRQRGQITQLRLVPVGAIQVLPPT